jgi:rare lipoprotein A
MASIRFSGFTLLICSLGALTACETGQEPFNFLKKDAPAAEASATEEGSPVLISVIGGDHDVEAPEIFKVTDKALWDGRPSLGGVWVAHSSVKDPQRVVIRNPANGKSVNGALFRREVDNPGPSLQLSSDAAQALGLLAGQPMTLEVVAIKRVEAPAKAPEPEAAPEAAPQAAPVAAAASEASITAQAIAPADGAGGETAAPKLTKAQERKAKREARKQERAAAKAALAAAAAETARLAAPATSSRPKKKPGSEGAASAQSTIEQKPLEEVVSTAEAAISKAAGQAAQADAPAATAAPAAAAAAAPKASEKLNRPYVQIAVFNVEANAEKAAADMRKAGLTAAVKSGSQDGNAFWRVIVGPAASVADRDAMTTRLKTLGYPDAYPVKK